MNTKIIKYLGRSILFLAFTSCNNLIETPSTPEYKQIDVDYTFYEPFDNGLGEFKAINASGDQIWTVLKDYKYAMMNGNLDNVQNENEDWLISPDINLPEEATSILTFDYALREFNDVANEATLWVSDDYSSSSDPSTATWTQLYTLEPMVNGISWNMMNAGEISLRAFKGKKVNIAFKYNSSSTSAGIWQIKNVIVKDRVPVKLPYSETFTQTLGRFVAINVSGFQKWYIDTHGYAYMTGYINSV